MTYVVFLELVEVVYQVADRHVKIIVDELCFPPVKKLRSKVRCVCVLNTTIWTSRFLDLPVLRNGGGLQGLVESFEQTHEEDWTSLL